MIKNVTPILATYLHPMFLFFDSLVSLQMAKSSRDKEKWLKHAEENLSQLKALSLNAPENYSNKVHLIEAEIAILCNNRQYALMHYKRAISLSKKNCFSHEEGLACEMLGMHHFSIGENDVGSKFLIQSYECYEIWGAQAKLKQLTEKYPSLSKKMESSSKFFNTELNVESQSQRSPFSDFTCSTAPDISSPPEQKRAKFYK